MHSGSKAGEEGNNGGLSEHVDSVGGELGYYPVRSVCIYILVKNDGQKERLSKERLKTSLRGVCKAVVRRSRVRKVRVGSRAEEEEQRPRIILISASDSCREAQGGSSASNLLARQPHCSCIS